MNTITLPATIQDLGDYAEAQGKTIVDLMPPNGFTLDKSTFGDYIAGYWDGPSFQGDGWKVTSQWTAEHGVTFYVDGNRDNAIQGAEAGKIAAALAEVSALI
ncbi:hypothetical protein QFZ60_000476 [Arthrobacter sp. B2I5]|uniref:hypothetical protein n=1 Tax=Arthrobacter sp. B2I5 TaxID=3042266 RepID=UPI002784465F|nr:hypothetical protein [Arthrobacter sp. B2I5]MDQ0824303.1 hypothetical protein [Arthrobacter sp. B2I5]